jgi:hypothetical protein
LIGRRLTRTPRLLVILFLALPLVASPSPTGKAAHAGGLCSAPPLNVGLDAYRHFDKVSYLELGDRTFGPTTADPAGANADADHVARTGPGSARVLLDEAGPGVVTFLRMREAYGAPWQLAVDDNPPVTIRPRDLGQAAPAGPPARAFPYPLSLHSDQTQGSSIVAGAIGFRDSMQWSTAGRNANFYAIGRRLPADAPVRTWTGAEAVDDVASALRGDAEPRAGGALRSREGETSLTQGIETTVAALEGGPRQLRSLRMRATPSDGVALGNARLRIYWDGERTPSVDAPLKYVAGVGAGIYDPAGRALVEAWPSTAGNEKESPATFSLFWPMPYHSSARITLTPSPLRFAVGTVHWRVSDEAFNDPASWWGTFHATYTVDLPVVGEDMTFLNITGSGRIVGTVVNFGRVGRTLEGDPRFYLDGNRTPQVQATGTEEWGLGGNYWRRGHQTSLPLGGLPSSDNNPFGSDADGAALYRFLIADSIPFNRAAVVRWEHGASNTSIIPYRAAVLWYGTPLQTALPTDWLDVGDAASRGAHQYRAPGAHPYALTAAFGYPVHAPLSTASGIATAGKSSFRFQLDPRNTGAFLRRVLDYGIANQRANVYVDGQRAGTWYTAGSFSGADRDGHVRRWREEELPLPPSLTVGKSSVQIEMRFVPTASPPDSAWTEFSYQLYSFVPPGCGRG